MKRKDKTGKFDFETSRRRFMLGGTAALGAAAGSRIGSLAFAGTGAPEDVLIFVFLRGGMDGLSVLCPVDGADRNYYEQARPQTQLPLTGSGAATQLDSNFALNRAAQALMPIWYSRKLAFLHASGLTADTRSHFDAQEMIELGTPDQLNTPNGWLKRHLDSTGVQAGAIRIPGRGVLDTPALAMGNYLPASLRGDLNTLVLTDPSDFDIDSGAHNWRQAQRTAARNLFGSGGTTVHGAASAALDASDILNLLVDDNYQPCGGVEYPNNTFGRQLRSIAQMIKIDIGLRVATIDLGGWDTHDNQGQNGGTFFNNLEDLAEGLAALYNDFDCSGWGNRVTIVALSEFGRRLRENADRGTDHGHGGVSFVLGGNVNGGRVFGGWPGLASEQLYDGADVAVTNDYRNVLAEIIQNRMQNDNIDYVFPGLAYQPMGIVSERPFFADDFEGGDMSRWSSHVG